MRRLDSSNFVQILILLITAYMAFEGLLFKRRADLIGVILFSAVVFLVIIYSVIVNLDVKLFQRLRKIDKLEEDLRKLKEHLDYRKIAEDLNTRLKIIESEMNRKGVLSPQAVILIIIIILFIIYLLRNYS